MKTILSGIELNRFLNFRTLISKCAGLIMAYASGLAIGKEGPFVHISSILCSLLSKLPFFKYIRRNNAAYMQVLSAATAVGVTSAFGTPVGGVFFSMEVTSTFYHVENLWRAFFVSFTAKLLSVILRKWLPFGLDLFELPAGHVMTYQLVELVAFAILGVVFGVLSGVFVRLMTLVFRLSRIHPWLQTSWGQLVRAAVVCLLIALVAFPLPLLRHDTSSIISYLGSPATNAKELWLLALFCVVQFIAILFSVAFTGAAAGVFGPVFLEGAFLGRLFGDLMAVIFPNLGVSPTAYAIVGAAAFASGVTRTISTALIVVELTYRVNLLIPVLLAVLLANFVGRLLSLSVYSVMIQAKDLPQLPRFKLFNQASSRTAGEIMRSDVLYLHATANYKEVAELVEKSDYPSFPLVDSDGYFCGTIRRSRLTSSLKHAGIALHSKSLTTLGQQVIERAVKHWDEKNHSFEPSTSQPRHLEPEDLEFGIGAINRNSLLDSDMDGGNDLISGSGDSPGIALDDDRNSSGALSINGAGTSLLSDDDAGILSSSPPPSAALQGPLSNTASFGRNAEMAKKLSQRQYTTMANVGVSAPDDFQDPQHMLHAPVPFVFNTNFAQSRGGSPQDRRMVDVDTTVVTISPEATVTKVHFMFTVLGLSHIFIVRRGKLLGLITRKDLIRAIAAMNLEKR